MAFLQKIFFLTVVIFFYAVNEISAQVAPLRFENYTTENGLPQNSGYSIAQTAEGFMWFGTQDGLCRYDGYKLHVYRKKNGDSLSLCGNQVNALHTDKEDNLWIATSEGVCIYNRLNDNFESVSVFLQFNSTIDKLNTKDLLDDADGNMWVVTVNEGLFFLQCKQKKVTPFFTGLLEKLSLGEIKKDEQKNICISTRADIYRYNGKYFDPLQLKDITGVPAEELFINHFLFTNGELWLSTLGLGLLRISLSQKKLIAQVNTQNKIWQLDKNEMSDLLQDKSNNIWVGTISNGIYKYNYTSNQLSNGHYSASDKYSIRKNYIIALFEDRQGIIWIGTSGGGIAKYDPGRFAFQIVQLTDNKGKPSPDNMVMSLYNTGSDGFIAGTQSGGIIKADREFGNMQFLKPGTANTKSILYDNIYQVDNDDKGNTWMATWGGLCCYSPGNNSFKGYTEKTDMLHREFYSIAFLEEENALLVSGAKGLYKFYLGNKTWQTCNDKNHFIENNIINGRYMWKERGTKNIWICSEGSGLLKYDFSAGLFTEYPQINKQFPTIRHLYKNGDNIWLATDFGLVLISEKKGTILKVYDTRSGLPGNVIYAILPDKKNNPWISTNYGISHLDLATGLFKNFDESYGLQGAEFNTAACCTDEKGRLYFGGINGINYFLPQDVPVNSYTASPIITGLSVMNNPVIKKGNIVFLKAIELPYNQNFISFEYANPNYSHTANNTFAVMLKGIDDDWIKVGNKNFASYTNLPPGKYMFMVKAANNEGKWSEQIASFSIIIHPPFWATWWFRILYISVALILAIWIYRQRIKNIKRQTEIDKQLSVYEMKALHAQMNPHFIFNCLNSIKEMILEGENANASRYLSTFAQMIRETLEQSKHTFISLRQSISYLERYIQMEKIRIDDFSYELRIDSNINTTEIKIPPLLLQPLVENAIWHGLKSIKGNKSLKIELKKENDKVCCIIEDNGQGINKSKNDNLKLNNESTAINNIRERIALLNEKFNIECSLVIMDKADLDKATGSGTIARLLIPFDID